MKPVLALLARIWLGLCIALMPVLPQMAMAHAMTDSVALALPCHGADTAVNLTDNLTSNPDASHESGCCCGTALCHCVSATPALPASAFTSPVAATADWTSAPTAFPLDHLWAPTPPPPRA